MRWKGLAILIAVLGAASHLRAQRYNFKFYGPEDGLRNLAVQVVLQDRTGFLWVGTQNGLYRYDGSRFNAFGKNEGLPGARIESLHESADGTLWTGTGTGLARRSGERFETVGLGVAQGIVGRAGIASDRSGRLYLATEKGLVTGTKTRDGFRFALIPRPARVSRDEAAGVYVDSSGTIWYGCGDSLCRLKNGSAHEVGSEEGLPMERWDAILGDPAGNLWVRSERSLCVRQRGAHRFQAVRELPESRNTYPTLALDPRGRLLLPTYRGLARQSGAGWQIIEAKEGLTTNDISAVVQDREGSIWLGLLGSGLARWLGYNEWESWGESEGLSRESVWSLARDTAGRLWVGTQYGLNYAEERQEKLVWRQQPIAGVEMIRTLAAARDGSLWIGADPGGLFRWDPRTRQARAFRAKEGMNGTHVQHVMVDPQGGVWASSRDGLFRMEPGSTHFEQIFPSDTQPEESFHMAVTDRHGQIWVAGDRGLARFAQGQWRRFTQSDGLKSGNVAHLAEDPEGSLWIGYYDAYGLTKLTALTGEPKFEHFTTAKGLHSDKSIFLGFDARGWLWSGTDQGVDVFDRMRWRHYGRSDGLIWDDCNGNAFMADAKGSVWIGTSRGLSRFRPSESAQRSVPPPVVFTYAKAGDRVVDPAASLTIPYARNSLQVQFAALTFVQEETVLFRYRMAGAETPWLETTQRELNFPKLLPGQYTLEVSARNAQGVWSVEPARLNFRVLTPWWLSWWFRLGAAGVTILIAAVIWKRRTSRMEAERRYLETAVEHRTRELSLEKQRVVEEKARAEHEKATVQQQKLEIERLLQEAQQASRFKSEFLANFSHEIRTPMNGILGMTDLVLATDLTADQRDYLETARLSAKSLLTVLNDVLDFSKIDAGHLDLSPVEFSLPQFMHETGRIFALTAAERKLSLDVRIADEIPDRVVGDPDRLRQILLNLVTNAIKFTPAGGVWIAVSQDAVEDGSVLLHFTVRDTGIGIPVEKQKLIFEAFRQADGTTSRKYGGTGLGLAICSRLVAMMGGAIHVESEPGQGSTFHFTARFGLAPKEPGTADSASLQNMLDVVGTAPGEPLERRPLRILLAEDNSVNQKLATRLLEKRGHQVVVAATGREALRCLQGDRFDIILMDVQMPDIDGLEATRIIREREKESGTRTPIIALTAHTMKGDREKCLDAGMDTYIEKPIDAVKFIEVVEATARETPKRAGQQADSP